MKHNKHHLNGEGSELAMEIMQRLTKLEVKLDDALMQLYGSDDAPGLPSRMTAVERRVSRIEDSAQAGVKTWQAVLVGLAFLANLAVSVYSILKDG